MKGSTLFTGSGLAGSMTVVVREVEVDKDGPVVASSEILAEEKVG